MSTKPSIVFCHGIWADASSFSKVIPPLQAEGYEVIAAQYGLDTPESDVAMGPIDASASASSGSAISRSTGKSTRGQGRWSSWLFSFRLGDASRPDAPGYPARPSCFACRAASQKAEMMMSRSPSHFVVWPNSTSNALPVGAITLPLGNAICPRNVPVVRVITVIQSPLPNWVEYGVYTCMWVAYNQGLDTGEPRTPQSTTPTSFRQWCEDVLKPRVVA